MRRPKSCSRADCLTQKRRSDARAARLPNTIAAKSIQRCRSRGACRVAASMHSTPLQSAARNFTSCVSPGENDKRLTLGAHPATSAHPGAPNRCRDERRRRSTKPTRSARSPRVILECLFAMPASKPNSSALLVLLGRTDVEAQKHLHA